MVELRDVLETLGMSQYYNNFCNEGFDTWATVMDITETDLDALGVRLGHRRKLQRFIQDAQGVGGQTAQLDRRRYSVAAEDGSKAKGGSYKASIASLPVDSDRSFQPSTAKRKYRRHPKTDVHAPERPPSAYVIFANKIRDSCRGQDLSFTEIAKLVGEKWQELDPKEREVYESNAQTLKDKYHNRLAVYKKTPEYASHQQYLAEFKAKHDQPQGSQESKRTKTEVDVTSRSSRSDTEGAPEDDATSRTGESQSDALSPVDPSRSTYEGAFPSSAKYGVTSAMESPTSLKHSAPSTSPRLSGFRRLPPIEVPPEDLKRELGSSEYRPHKLPMHVSSASGDSPSASTFPRHFPTMSHSSSRSSAYHSDAVPSLSHGDSSSTWDTAGSGSGSGSGSGGSGDPKWTRTNSSHPGTEMSDFASWRTLPLPPALAARSSTPQGAKSPSSSHFFYPEYDAPQQQNKPLSPSTYRRPQQQQQLVPSPLSANQSHGTTTRSQPPGQNKSLGMTNAEASRYDRQSDRREGSHQPENNLATLLRASEVIDERSKAGSASSGNEPDRSSA